MEIFSGLLALISYLFDFIIHIDAHLQELLENYGRLVYFIIFAIIFVETGFIIMPFLPGDSLLFICGSLAGAGLLDVSTVMATIFVAAVLGDQTNFTLGKLLGQYLWRYRNRRWYNQKAIDSTHTYFERFGPFTIVLARFVPLIRTFAPFVAGSVNMKRRVFFMYNVLGALIWVSILVPAGYFLGQLNWVKDNLSLVIYATIVLSLLPIIWVWFQGKNRSQK